MNDPRAYAFATGIIVLVLLAACTTTAPPILPKADRVSMHVASGTISTLTEAAAEDFLIPESQVFVSGRGFSLLLPGLVGAAISTQVNRSRNQSAVAAAEDSLRLSFVDELKTALRSRIASLASTNRYFVTESLENSQIVLLPSAKLTVADDDLADLSFRMTTRFTDAITRADTRKEYFYIHGERRSVGGLNGWSNDDAKPLKQVAARAMVQLSAALIDDIDGSLSRAFESADQRVLTYQFGGPNGKPLQALLLKEYLDHVVVAPKFADRPARGMVVVLERQLLLR